MFSWDTAEANKHINRSTIGTLLQYTVENPLTAGTVGQVPVKCV